jgi:ribonuclease HI
MLKAPPPKYLVAHTDGGSRGNPGPSGYGVVIHDPAGNKLTTCSQYLGYQTNNFAEYQALIAALEYARAHGPNALKVISDSELIVRQIKGIYRVKDPSLRKLYERASKLISQLDWFSIEHVLRDHNREADELANQAMDKGSGRSPAEARQPSSARQEFSGIVRQGKVELLDGTLPEGTQVQVRIRRS